MEYVTRKIEYPQYKSRAFQLYFQDMDIGILDIETTGLNPKNSAFILGGIVTPDKDGLKTEQFFAEDLSQEKETLAAFWKTVSKKDVLITFNGQHFDLPFMKERAPEMITDFPFHLDLYLMVKNFSPIRKFMPNLRQKTIENYMGLWQYRKDEISGKDSIDLYYRFLSEKSSDLKDKILLHNHDDIVQLYRLLKVLEKTEFHKAMFCRGFPVTAISDEVPDLIIDNIQIKSGQLNISGRQHRKPVEYCCYEYGNAMCHIQFKRNEKKFIIQLPVTEQSGMHLLDMDSLGFDSEIMNRYPACQEGFLILQDPEKINYLEINHFIKLFIERMANQWIINR